MRPPTTTLAAVGAAAAASGALLLAGAGAGAGSAAASSTSPPQTVTARVIAVPPGTLSIGSQLLASRIASRRTYFGNSFGITLGRDRENAVYPVQTGNGGRTWHTDGPALMLPDAVAPLTVGGLSAATRTLQYAFGGGSVIDVTRDGGPTWRGATFDGTVLAVVPGSVADELTAFVDGAERDGRPGPTSEYVTHNGGASWQYVNPTSTSTSG